MTGERLTAGIDIGTTMVKLALYDTGWSQVAVYKTRAPLEYRGSRAGHDPHRLLETLKLMAGKAYRLGARLAGLSVYRASPLAWDSSGPLSDVVLWLDRERRHKAYESMPLAARLASRLPVAGQALSMWSPLPVIAWLQARHAGKAWTLDAFLLDRYAGEYATVASVASLSGAFNPYTLKRLDVMLRLARARPELTPRLTGETSVSFSLEGIKVGSLVADQQAALIGASCLDGGCVKLSLGTGAFATMALPGRPPLLTGGLTPLVVALIDEKPVWGVEAMAPGLGIAVEELVAAAGGFSLLEEATPEGCLEEWTGTLLLPGPALRRRGEMSIVATPGLPGLRGMPAACGAVVSAALIAAGLVGRGPMRGRRVRAVGGLTRLRVVRDLVAAAAGRSIEYYPGVEASARGAAMLAAVGEGLLEPRDIDTLKPGEPVESSPGGEGWRVEEGLREAGALVSGGSWRRCRRLLERTGSRA